MRAEYIRVEPFKFKEILAVHIEKAMNSHGAGMIRGYIRSEDEELYASRPISSTPVIVRAIGEEGEERIIFYGILSASNITRENAQLLMEIQFTAYTRQMDLSWQTRAFQNPQCTYQEVLKFLCGRYENSAVIVKPEISGTPIQELLVQYQETNWEFLLRLASHFSSVIIADYLTPGVKFYFGLPDRQVAGQAGTCEYRLEKSPLSYQYKLQNDVTGMSEYDEMSVIIKSQDLWEIGDRVSFEDRPYVVCRSESGLDGHQLNHVYVLKTENGLKMPKTYNSQIIGASIDGIVTGVKSTVVSISMGIEDVKPSSRWYPYATVFSSPDGSGWYCMPQAGDEIRLYFPTRSEKHAYAVSSVHQPVAAPASPTPGGFEAAGAPIKTAGREEPRTNPGSNELKSPDGKIIHLGESEIILSNGKGLTITMTDGAGIEIVSSGSVNLDAGGDVSIRGNKVTLTASSSVSIQSGSASVVLEGSNAIVSGINVKVQ